MSSRVSINRAFKDFKTKYSAQFAVTDAPRNGDCFFYAVANALDSASDSDDPDALPRHLRAEACSFIQALPDEEQADLLVQRSPSINEYVRIDDAYVLKMKKSGTYADGPTVAALCKARNLVMTVHLPDGQNYGIVHILLALYED